jgi:3',5'-cyclic AMP phosphodiesterase CpdA
MRFLHCSDLHVTQRYWDTPWLSLGWRRWIAMWEVMGRGRGEAYRDARLTIEQMVGDLERHAADHLLVSGDLTGYAMEDEFRSARAALGVAGRSRATCSVIPGNHDYFTPESVECNRFEQHFGDLLESDLPEYRAAGAYPFIHLKGDDVAVVGLHSARKAVFPGLAYGDVGRRQLEALAALVDDRRVRHRAVLVMVHHAPNRADGTPDAVHHGLRDAASLNAVLRGERFALLHGHLHDRFRLAGTATRPQTFCAGSSTIRGNEGYWIIDAVDGRISGTPHVPASTSARVLAPSRATESVH